MFIGRPQGNYDRLLDVSRAVTGSLFFVPSVAAAGEPGRRTAGGRGRAGGDATAGTARGQPERPAAGSLNIGSLRGASHDE